MWTAEQVKFVLRPDPLGVACAHPTELGLAAASAAATLCTMWIVCTRELCLVVLLVGC